METKKWYVGQQVWDKTVSDEAGEIISINDVQIVVEFLSLYQWSYSLNGELLVVGRNYPTLSTKPYEIKMEGFSQEFEENNREPQIGDMVYAWNEENFLDLTHDIYMSYGTGIKRVYKVGNKVFKYCSVKNPLIK